MLKEEESEDTITKELNEIKELAEEDTTEDKISCTNCGSVFSDIEKKCPICEHLRKNKVLKN